MSPRQAKIFDGIIGPLIGGAIAGLIAWGVVTGKVAALETGHAQVADAVRVLQVAEGKRDERDLWIARTLEKISKDVETLTKERK